MLEIAGGIILAILLLPLVFWVLELGVRLLPYVIFGVVVLLMLLAVVVLAIVLKKGCSWG